MTLSPVQSPLLSGIAHGFFTREGGVSTGIFASLNCGYGSQDERALVQENRTRVAAYFGQPESHLLTLYQIHSAVCIPVHAPLHAPLEADAMVSNTPGLVLGILTADCGPVLFSDAQAGIIGCAHAGWKGAHGGILEHTVAAMVAMGASRQRIVAALGPCIGQASYEVGPEFVERIGNTQFFTDGDGDRSHFNLPAYVHHLLQQTEISAISLPVDDTCADESRFFSYRRTTLRQEGNYGRQISCIMLNK